ncbi:hypothetical protein [Caulobacter sp. RL271]|uniref:Transmembrane protein n=1 Tax=Caulobacter segnis TaxID=88688 RepID=A0ABY4ZVC1_9CAUL|nr:hypothetical protein [Caulobacter segnis]USQ96521.1 hypothetical protein MZV50_02700 [Caulobacter segnis]
MNSSGLLYSDAGMLSIAIYVFWGGWLVTLAGLIMSILVMRQPQRLALGVALAIGSLAPFAYFQLWVTLKRFAPSEPKSSDLSIWLVVAGMAGCVLAAPLGALVHVLRAQRRENTP